MIVSIILGGIIGGYFGLILGFVLGVGMFSESRPVGTPYDIEIYFTKSALVLIILATLIGAVLGGYMGYLKALG